MFGQHSAFVEVRCIGAIDEESNMKYSETLTDVVAKALKISPDRVFLNFVDVQGINWGWKKTLVSTML